MKAMQALAMAVALAWSGAQAADDPAKADPKKAPAQKAAPKKQEPARAEPKKAEPKKAPAKKPADAPKKPVDVPGKSPEAPKKTADPNVKVYKSTDPNAPKLRDKQGNTIPTNPDAYDISSALKK